MVCNNCIEPGRRGMAISVIILGGALCTVMLAYFVFGDASQTDGIDTIRMIAVIHRHGERTPTELYKNDPNRNYKWPNGLGVLTQRGSLQMYNLGINLRNRYSRLLPENGMYSQDNMNVLSSYKERCIMSVQSFLAGLMPPSNIISLLPISWQPVAVQSLPRDDDYLIVQKRPCAKYDEIASKTFSHPSPSLRELNENNQELFQFLTLHSGQNISNVRQVEFLYSTLSIEKDAGLSLPDWTQNVFPDRMRPLAERSLAVITETDYMKRVKGGPLVTDIADKMENKRSNLLNPDRSIFIYSGHDVTLVNVMNALGIISQTANWPDFASALVFELHQNPIYSNDFDVKIVYYQNSDVRIPKEIAIPKCGNPCSLTEFMISIKPIEMKFEDFDDLCKIV